MTTPSVTAVLHEPFCLPRAGEPEPRMESYRLPRYAGDGTTVVSHATVQRCIECGAQVVIG